MFEPSVQREIGAFRINLSPGGVSFVWKEILIADSTPSCTEPLVYWVNSNGSVWVEVSRRLSVNPSSPQPSSWACCFTSRTSPDLAPTNVTYFTPRPDLTPTAYRLNILGRQSESNSHPVLDLLIYKILVNSCNSSYIYNIFVWV